MARGPKEKQVNDPVNLEFEVVPAEEAKLYVVGRNSGRFIALKESLMQRLGEMRKTEALVIPLKNGTPDTEMKAIKHACYDAVRRGNLDFMVRYSTTKNAIVFTRGKKQYQTKRGEA